VAAAAVEPPDLTDWMRFLQFSEIIGVFSVPTAASLTSLPIRLP